MTITSLYHIRAVLQSEADELCACIRRVCEELREAQGMRDHELIKSIKPVKARLEESLRRTETALAEIDEILRETDGERG